MRLLVLGGTHHVGRAVVEAALARGDDVTTVNRGVSGKDVPGARARRADRTDQAELRAALAGDTWDAVVDTWSRAPRVVSDAASLLSGRAGHYGYVSSRSVYRWPMPAGADESAPVTGGDPASEQADDYAAAKRGGELAVLEHFDGPSVLARAGLILGPYELVGRMPWWLRRIERGGDVLAPGPRDMPIQYIDCRDLAAWLLHAADERISGAFNAVSRPGHATMESLLGAAVAATGSDARLVWVDPEVIEAAGIQPWIELPVWVPPDGEDAAVHDGDVSAIYAAGLTCRPVQETVADTWRWLQAEGDPPVRDGGLKHGLDPDREREVLAGLG
ncbi:MAG TPA: NAD-dependent epimerase/dehydratase family protein [Streptosporangiaceae bacterium]|nr:NAD-dependent epimerase/dehydratase family protein [Streptosporangiaceae bacterium]